jgi:galactokinase
MTNTPAHPRATAAFTAQFGGLPALLVRAPGRVNLIGEHTDYSDGFCLPCAIDRDTVVAIRARSDGQVRVLACDQGASLDAFDAHQPITPNADLPWSHYVRGTLAALQATGLDIGGAELAIAGDVPQGAGLSSSASIEIAVAHAFKLLRGWQLDGKVLARAGQQAEHRFAGCQCGILDQLASVGGVAGHALLLDCRSLATRPVPLPPGTAVVVIDSGIARGLVDSEYNLRRQQCADAARLFGVAALRDVSLARWQAEADTLPPLLARRAGHVISENARTLHAADALADGDLARMGALMRESHASMRDDFEITLPAIDALAALVDEAIGGQGGARMTGGGFGGCVVALAAQARVPAIRAAVARDYRSPQGLAATLWVCQASAGAGVWP